MRRVEFTHDLIKLAEALGAPEEIFQAASELSPDYVITRYPNAANAAPARLYNSLLQTLPVYPSLRGQALS